MNNWTYQLCVGRRFHEVEIQLVQWNAGSRHRWRPLAVWHITPSRVCGRLTSHAAAEWPRDSTRGGSAGAVDHTQQISVSQCLQRLAQIVVNPSTAPLHGSCKRMGKISTCAQFCCKGYYSLHFKAQHKMSNKPVRIIQSNPIQWVSRKQA